MATSDDTPIPVVAWCTDIRHIGAICDCVCPFDWDAKSPSSGSKRSWWNDDDFDGSSSDGRPDHKRARKRPSGSRRLHLLREIDIFIHPPSHRYVDKTPCILGLPETFCYLLLRPPQFGKTTLLSVLYHYYDVHGADDFDDRFRSLAVVTQPSCAVPHSQHLCLYFDLRDVSVYSNIALIQSRLRTRMSSVLSQFLIEYAAELGLAAPENFLGDGELSTGFSKVLKLVKECGYTLFVAVDNCDAPVRTRARAHIDCPIIHKKFATPRDIELLLDSDFWAPLLAGNMVDKLIIAGALHLQYPSLKNLSATPTSLQAACGFTEQEALEMVRSVADEPLNIEDLRRSCGHYTFSSQDAGGCGVEPLHHPQLVINRTAKLPASLLHRAPTDTDPFRLLSDILDLLPEESDNPGALVINDLIQLLATGAVDIAGKFDAPVDFDRSKITWSTLFHAGALTYDRQLADTLCVANPAALSLIHSRVDNVFDDRHQLLWTFLDALAAYNRNPQPFLDLISEVLQDLTQRSFGKKHEPNLRGVLELVMNKRAKPTNPIILLPPDINRVEVPAYRRGQVHVWELKTVTLRGMWQATNLNDEEPTIQALETLHGELVDLDEDELLARPYRVWSPALNAMETVLVESFFDPKPEVPQFLAVGGARVLMRERAEDEEEDENENEELEGAAKGR
ncbi:hypothetical protein C8R47DRAFT_472601 [Mycena vitilis]|nr:hypothetical protein C8R47DRAFT_472601 [Mycena vitilis]